MWLESGFKDFKRGGFRWEQSKIPDPLRMERLIMVMAVALFHLIRLGTGALITIPLASDPAHHLSLVTLGWLRLLAYSIRDLPLTETLFSLYAFPSFFPRNKTYP